MKFSVLGVSLSAVSFCGLVCANVIHVPADQPTIQAAINAAANGDTVQVAPGTYAEKIDFSGKAITVAGAQTEIGNQTTQATIIDGGHSGTVVTFKSGEGPQSVLTGFTIQNGNASFDGGGIRISNASPTIAVNNIENNTAGTEGAGISVNFGSPLIHDNWISNNSETAGFSGGNGLGIYIGGASAAQVIHNYILNNTAQQGSGGGIALFAAGAALIQGNYIGNNSAYSQGGGIWIVNDSSSLIVNNVIYGNSAPAGGGIYWLVPSGSRGPYVVNNTVADNTATQGPAIFAGGFQNSVQMINNILTSAAGSIPLYCDGTYSSTPPALLSNDIFAAGSAAYGGLCAGLNGSSGNISADPLFSNNLFLYGLAPGSPAIDSGTATLAPATDLNGRPRPLDGNGDGTAAFDRGAYEMQTVSAVNVNGAPNPATSVQTITFTANVTPAIASGTVQFFDGAASLGVSPASNGSAVLNITLAAGTHSISAVFTSTNPSYTGAASLSFTELVKAGTLTSLSAAPAQPGVGQTVTLTAGVSPNTATGAVQFFDGASLLGAGALSGGIAKLTIATLAVGTRSLTAVYSGDANFVGSTSPAVPLFVSKITPSISVSATPNPGTFGQSVTFTASLLPLSATGTVQFFDGSASLGTAAVTNGKASVATSALTVGIHSITAAYSGDGNDGPVTSTVYSFGVNSIATSTTLTSSANPSVRNKAVTFTASVSPSSATGSVEFLDGGKLLGTVALNSGRALFTTSNLVEGTHPITAIYLGTQNFAQSTSAVLNQVITKH